MELLNDLDSEELLRKTQELVSQERHIQAELLHYLKEIERRKLFLERGYGSLFDFVAKELGYSESSAYRRIQAMRLLKDLPEVEKQIIDGSLTLTSAAQVQAFFRNEQKNNQTPPRFDKKKVLQAVQNKSSREVEKHLLELNPNNLPIGEKVKQVSDTRVEIRLVIPAELKEKMDQLKLLLSHVHPEMNYQQLIEYLSSKALLQLDPEQTKPRSRATPAPKVKMGVSSKEMGLNSKAERNRYVPEALRRLIFKRDNSCCSYVDPKSKKRCDSKYQIQIDHIVPFALGGQTTESNLRLLCASHNRWRAEKTFGVVRT
ncbi:HNH endonuclease [Bdellovibrio svalbardensis]|uniref:HNH endonuclease n=1 Tax=Bdellovibrio svalbardensis TaxID=2972972 RepID=A0ABT6DGE5_9BACT|nr:HNH endonuclease signature motif containing protein [Bdellovibrio svalbardensis]MDG0815921.1 HNH endonuclease [Bdellovibrio svalbardensis]